MALLLQLQMSWQRSLLGQRRKNGPPLGLKNLGNTCYINSVLQCLTYTPPLANFCLKYQHSSFCNSGSEPSERKRECPFCILEKRIVRSLSSDLTLDAPVKIVNCLRIFAEQFRCGHQEDAHEFLRYVIDACHNACLRLKKLRCTRKGNTGETEGGNSVVKEIFGGSLQSQVKCLLCGMESNKVDEIMDISLDVLHSSSLKAALQKFFQPEILDGSNKYKCENCKKLVAARKQMSIHQAPNVLVIQLKRFEGIYGGKIDKAIAFDEVLVLSNLMCNSTQDPQPEYNLFGTIVHSGYSQESGHYYAYIKDAMGRWYCCNDSYVSLSTLQEVLSEKVYILFFSRTNQRPMSVNDAYASNAVKSRDCNGNGASESLMSAPSSNTSNGARSHDGHGNRASESLTAALSLNASNGVKSRDGHGNKSESLMAVSSIASNGVKSRGCNGSEASENLSTAFSSNTLHTRPNVEESSEKDISSISKIDKATSSPLRKFSILRKPCSKKVIPVTSMPTTEVRTNGDLKHSFKENNHKDVSSSITTTYYNKSKTVGENGHALGLANGNGKTLNIGINNLVKSDMLEGKCTKISVTTRKGGDNHDLHNGVVSVLVPKRKQLEDSCVLFGQDDNSRAKFEEIKEVLEKEASTVLRSCGWTDKVYNFMTSKKLCTREEGKAPPHFDDFKKLLIAKAKPTFISQVPDSLKEDFIERLESFSQIKYMSGS